MAKKRRSGKALAERRRRAMQLHLAEFSQEEIAEKLGVHPSVVCRDLQWIRDSICPRESPWIRPPTEVKFDVQFNAIKRNSWQFFANASNFTQIHGNQSKFLQVPAGPSNCGLRSASHVANWTYIAGYAPSSLFRAGLNPAWTGIANGLKSNDSRTGEKLAEKTNASQKNFVSMHKIARRKGSGKDARNRPAIGFRASLGYGPE